MKWARGSPGKIRIEGVSRTESPLTFCLLLLCPGFPLAPESSSLRLLLSFHSFWTFDAFKTLATDFGMASLDNTPFSGARSEPLAVQNDDKSSLSI